MSESWVARQGITELGTMTTPLPHTVIRFVEAVNRGDPKTFLAVFPHDGVVIDTGRRFAGQDKIRGGSDRELIRAHGPMTVKKGQQTKNIVTFTADWKSNFCCGPARFEFLLEGEKIRELRISGE